MHEYRLDAKSKELCRNLGCVFQAQWGSNYSARGFPVPLDKELATQCTLVGGTTYYMNIQCLATETGKVAKLSLVSLVRNETNESQQQGQHTTY